MVVLLLSRNRLSASQNFFFMVMIAAESLISIRKIQRFQPLIEDVPSAITSAEFSFFLCTVVFDMVQNQHIDIIDGATIPTTSQVSMWTIVG